MDRTACPWLIRRFVDPKAEFIFVSSGEVLKVAKKENATPYDAQGIELGHHGDRCSFDAIIGKYAVDDPAVLDLAKIVRTADTGRMDLAAEAAGLEAVMSGISIVAKDDHEAVEKASIVYDALYIHGKMKLIEERLRLEIQKMDRGQRRDFLRKKLLERKKSSPLPM